MSASDDPETSLPAYLYLTAYADIWQSIRDQGGPVPYWVKESAIYRDGSPRTYPAMAPFATAAVVSPMAMSGVSNERSSSEDFDSDSEMALSASIPPENKPFLAQVKRIPLDNPPRFANSLDVLPPMPLPSAWRQVDSTRHQVLESLQIRCENEDISVRANNPIPHATGLYYFEITLVSNPPGSEVFVGFTDPVNARDLSSRSQEPTWSLQTFDGQIAMARSPNHVYAQPSVEGDVIGCCYMSCERKIFFTRNGEHLGIAFNNVSPDVIYPAMLIEGVAHISTNFGQKDFVFDIRSEVLKKKNQFLQANKALGARCKPESRDGPVLLNQVIVEYLWHAGLGKTAAVLNRQLEPSGCDVASEDCVPSEKETEHRMEIRRAVLAGDLDLAVRLINKNYPGLTQQSEKLHFELEFHRMLAAIKRNEPIEALHICRHVHAQFGSTEDPELLVKLNRMLEVVASPVYSLPDAYQGEDYSELYDLVNSTILEHLGHSPEATLPLYLAQAARLMRVGATELREVTLARFQDYMKR